MGVLVISVDPSSFLFCIALTAFAVETALYYTFRWLGLTPEFWRCGGGFNQRNQSIFSVFSIKILGAELIGDDDNDAVFCHAPPRE